MSTTTTAASDKAIAATADLAELRGHLFAALRGLRDKADPMPIDRARTVSEVARTLIDTARVELEAAAQLKAMPTSSFLPLNAPAPVAAAAPATDAKLPKRIAGTPPIPNGIKSITRHVLADDDEGPGK